MNIAGLGVQDVALDVGGEAFGVHDFDGSLGHHQLVKITKEIPVVMLHFVFSPEGKIPLHTFLSVSR
jgi:hypothetical protein